MCIAFLTTSHPNYALIAINNRDEYILRPTSKPHWWKGQVDPATTEPASSSSSPAEVDVLSSRDLQRAEHGTWLGMTKDGNLAILTNYRETDTHDAAHPIHGKRSRGGMVTAWLCADPKESTEGFVRRLVESGDVKGVGGFSLICGKLRKVRGKRELEPLAIISNRHDHMDHVPWICGKRGNVYGLSNATYVAPCDNEVLWPKIQKGSEMLAQTLADAAEKDISEDELREALFKILDVDNFPPNHQMDLEDGIPLLKNTIFVPAFGGPEHQQQMKEAREKGKKLAAAMNGNGIKDIPVPLEDDANGFSTGLYGTQRQTIILVDWDGNVSYTERALWDHYGNPIPRGQADMMFNFIIDGWETKRLSPSL